MIKALTLVIKAGAVISDRIQELSGYATCGNTPCYESCRASDAHFSGIESMELREVQIRFVFGRRIRDLSSLRCDE